MTGKTHMMGGTLTGFCWMAVTPPNNYAELGIMIGATTLGSLLPDIDHHSSKVTRSNIFTRVIGGFVSGVFKHRQQVHTVYACVIFAVIGYILSLCCGNLLIQLMVQLGLPAGFTIGPYAMVMAIGIFLGSMNHLVWDTFNPQGILWLYPSKKRISICFIQTGSVFETVFYVINIILVVIAVYALWERGIFLC